MPISQCEFTLTTILEQLQKDPWPRVYDKRPLRSTGTALTVAFALLESAFQNSGARIMLFAGGACTQGPGLVVGPELKEPIRSHNDIEKDVTKHVKKAVKFYEAMAKRVADKGHVIDIFAGCLDQVGLMEMKSLVNTTNGFMVLSDSFNTVVFKQSFLRIFNKDGEQNLQMGFNATLEVQVCEILLSHLFTVSKHFLFCYQDYQRASCVRLDWTCSFWKQKGSLCRRNCKNLILFASKKY
jgi:protein transport protein SEC23